MKKQIILGFIIAMLPTLSCKDFLDQKPDIALQVPATLNDLQALINNETQLNQSYPSIGEIASDYYYLTTVDFLARNENARTIYTWDREAITDNTWSFTYAKIFFTNLILQEIDKVGLGTFKEIDRQRIKGSALFIRGMLFHQLSIVFAPQFEAVQANTNLGIPLKLSADINEKITRASLEQTYNQIEKDLNAAVDLLPIHTAYPTQPTKAAAHALLARVYLTMNDFDKALNHAELALKLKNELLNFNQLSTTSATPIGIYNKEVIFHATISSNESVFTTSRAKVDTILYRDFINDDLRKAIYFKKNTDGSYAFKGSYSGANGSALFGGIATDEVYLTKAECLARKGNIAGAMQTLNALLISRFKTNSFAPYSAGSAEMALKLILAERQKELCFRGGIRWADLKRLNKETGLQKVLQRNVAGETYTLQPNESRYVYPIPYDVIIRNGLTQN